MLLALGHARRAVSCLAQSKGSATIRKRCAEKATRRAFGVVAPSALLATTDLVRQGLLRCASHAACDFGGAAAARPKEIMRATTAIAALPDAVIWTITTGTVLRARKPSRLSARSASRTPKKPKTSSHCLAATGFVVNAPKAGQKCLAPDHAPGASRRASRAQCAVRSRATAWHRRPTYHSVHHLRAPPRRTAPSRWGRCWRQNEAKSRYLKQSLCWWTRKSTLAATCRNRNTPAGSP